MIPETNKFTLIAPLSAFPSDNKLDSMPLRERIAIKKQLKTDAFALTLEWFQKHKIKHFSVSRKEPLFREPVRLKLTVYLTKGMTLDVHNLSVKHFLDQIVLMGILADDSIKEIPECVASFGGFLPGGSYAEFCLEVIEKQP